MIPPFTGLPTVYIPIKIDIPRVDESKFKGFIMSIPPVSATATTNARCPIDQSADGYSEQEESDQSYKPGGCCDPTCNIL